MTETSYLTQSEAAEYVRLSTRTLERHRITGTGAKFIKAGSRVLYRKRDLDEWLDSRTFSSTSEVPGS